MRRILLKTVTLLFAISALTVLVLHGCSKPPQGQTAASAMSAPSPSASASATEEEEDPPFLGATKAAIPVRPKKQKK